MQWLVGWNLTAPSTQFRHRLKVATAVLVVAWHSCDVACSVDDEFVCLFVCLFVSVNELSISFSVRRLSTRLPWSEPDTWRVQAGTSVLFHPSLAAQTTLFSLLRDRSWVFAPPPTQATHSTYQCCVFNWSVLLKRFRSYGGFTSRVHFAKDFQRCLKLVASTVRL